MGLTKAQANARLSKITTAEELRQLIKEIDAKGSGSKTMLWSGYAGQHGNSAKEGIHSSDITASLRKNDSSIRTVATTEVSKFLDLSKDSKDYNPELDKKLKNIFKDNKDGISAFLYGPTSGKPPKRVGKGVWDDVSENFIKQAQGDVRLVVGGAGADKIFAQTEIHALLANPAVKSIEGVPIEGLRDLAKTSGVTRVLQLLMGLSEANTGMIQIHVDSTGRPIQAPDGTYRLDATDYMKMNTMGTTLAADMRSVVEFIPAERRLKHIEAVEEIFRLNPILRGMNYTLPFDPDLFRHQEALTRITTFTGRIGDVLSMTTMLAEAGGQLHQGDHRAAHDTVTGWAIENAGSFAAGRLASLLVAPLMATGPVGMIIGAGIIIGASVGGSDLARRLHRKLRDGFKDIEKTVSPLILDLDGNGIQTLSLAGTAIYFDHDSNGFAEKTGWVAPNDGLLVLDLNRNGKIDHGRELFGNHTQLANGTLAKNGFVALAMYDINRDQRIDSRDPIWNRLQVWRDRNSNGLSETGELATLEAANVKSLLLTYSSSKDIDANGNAHREKGAYQRASGNLAPLNDVWFAKDTLNSRQLQLRQVDARTSSLPNLPGIGIVPSLHQALMAPEGVALRDTLTKWMGATRRERISLNQTLLFQWCDASNNPLASTQRMMDLSLPFTAEKVAVIEKLVGQIIPDTEQLLGPAKVDAVHALYSEVEFLIEMILSNQVHVQPLLDLAVPTETTDLGAIQMDLTASVNHLRSQFKRDPDPSFIPMIQWQFAQRGPGGVAFFEELRRIASMQADALGLAMRRQPSGTDPWEWLRGTAEDDEITGTHRADLIEARAGSDTIRAGEGNDMLHGGPGSDVYYGGAGADTYYISQNNADEYDIVFDDSSPIGSADRVVFCDVNSTDMRLSRDMSELIFSTANQQVARLFDQTNPRGRIEEFHFADGVSWDFNTLMLKLPIQGSHANDTLVGIADTTNRFQGLSGHDSLTGGALGDHLEGQIGNDRLRGMGGQDTLDGGEGNDTLIGEEGGDCYIFAANGGHDRLIDVDQRTAEQDWVVFSNLSSAALSRVQRIGQDLQLHFGTTTSLTLVNQLQPFSRIEQFHFANGTTWDHTTLLQQVS